VVRRVLDWLDDLSYQHDLLGWAMAAVTIAAIVIWLVVWR
jgi:hypothetical protein